MGSPEPPLLQAQLSQPLLPGEELQPLHHLSGPALEKFPSACELLALLCVFDSAQELLKILSEEHGDIGPLGRRWHQ